MTRVLTARFGAPYADRMELLPAVSVERRATLGQTLSDGPSLPWNRKPAANRRLDFPAVHATCLTGVELFRGHIVRNADAIFIDTSIGSLLMRTEAEAEQLGDKLLGEVAAAQADKREIVPIDAPVLLTNNEGSFTWGHWLIHNFPRIALAAAAMPDLKIMVPSTYFGSLVNFGATLTEFGIPRSRLIPTQETTVYRLKTCVLIDFLYARRSIHPHSLEIFDSMREIPAFHVGEVLGRIAIARTPGSTRGIANPEDFARVATQSGYRMQTLGDRPFGEQIDRWRLTKKICAVLGSDFANIVFAPPGNAVVVLTPSWFGDDFFFDLAAARGLVWNELFCSRIGMVRQPRQHSSFYVDPEALEQILKRS